MPVREFISALAAVATLMLCAPARAQSSPSDYTYATRYDAARRVVGTIAPDPDGSGPLKYAAVRTTYDPAGNAIRQEKGELAGWQDETVAPSSWSGFTVFSKVETGYDAMDRKTVEAAWGYDTATSALVESAVTQYGYDAVGRLECTAERLNPATWSSLPSSACTLGTAGSYGPDRITRTVYDAAGQVLKTVKAYGTALQQDYVTYTYSANGKVLSVKDANGNVAGYTYDGFDRLARWSFPDKTATGSVSTTDYEAYGYDANGNRTSLRKRDGRTLTYSYDALNRMTVKVVPDACVAGYACTTPPASAVRDVYYGYDLQGLQLYARFDSATGGDGVSASYDGFGRQAGETVSMGGTSRTVYYAYNPDGVRRKVSWPDGVTVAYALDGLDRPAMAAIDGATVATMAYDARGQQAGETRGSVATTFGYDPVGRLASLSDDLAGTASDIASTFAYSPANQLVSRTRSNTAYAWTGYVDVSRAYAVNGLNQYTSAGAATFGYDANGNLASDGTASYTYDAENRLVADQAGTMLTYDPLGRLYAVATPSTTETYLYAGDQRIAEYDGSGTMTARYVPGAGSDNPLLWYPGSATTSPRALQGDERGSIVSVADASGVMLGINSYDECGIPAATNTGRYGYTGQLWIPQLGLWYYKARIFSPTLCRFLQTDPIGYDDQVNLYAYVDNDPTDKIDPTGEDGSNEHLEDVLKGRVPGAVPPEKAASSARILGVAMDIFATVVGGPLEISAKRAGTELVERAMSRAELKATQQTGLVRGGRNGEHFVSDSVNRSAQRAQQRLSLPTKPEVRVRLEVAKGKFSAPSKIEPKFGMPGGGMERSAAGRIPARVLKIDEMTK